MLHIDEIKKYFEQVISAIPEQETIADGAHVEHITSQTISLELLNKQLQPFLECERAQHQTLFCELIELENVLDISVNHGYKVYDIYYKMLMKEIMSLVGEDALLLRINDNQMVLFTEWNEHQKMEVTGQIIDLINTPIRIFEHNISKNAVIGVAVFPEDGKTTKDLVANAEIALKKAQYDGTNRFAYFNQARSEKDQQMQIIIRDLRKAIDENNLFVKYQPIYDIDSMDVVGCEALLRWNHPSIDIIGPRNFISLVEKSGLSQKLFNWILTTVENDIRHRSDSLKHPTPVYLKLTQNQFYMNNLCEVVNDILKRFGLNHSNLIMQVQEADVVDQPGATETILQQLKQAGIYTCIAGASVHPLTEILVEQDLLYCLKLERHLVNKIIEDKATREELSKLRDFCKTHNTMMVVTGIEGNKQLNSVRSHHFTYGQGYLLGAPMLNYQFTELLRRKQKMIMMKYS